MNTTMMLHDLSIRQKLRTNLAFIILFFILFTCLVFIGFNRLKNEFLNVTEDTVPDIIAILELKAVSKRLVAEIQGFVATGEAGEIEEFNTSLGDFQEWMEKWKISPEDVEEHSYKDQLEQKKNVFTTHSKTLFELGLQQGTLLKEFTALSTQLQEQIRHIHLRKTALLPEAALESLLADTLLLHTTVYQALAFAVDDAEDGTENVGEEEQQRDGEYTGDGDAGEAEPESIEKTIASLQAALDEFTKVEPNLEISVLVEKLTSVSLQLIDGENSISQMLEEVEEYEEKILETLDEIVSIQTGEVQNAFYSTDRVITLYFFLFLTASMISLLISAVLSRLIDRSITLPLADLNNVIAEVAEGNLSIRAQIYNHDEIGSLAQGFNQMTQSLEQTTVSTDYMDNILNSMTESLVVTSLEGIIESTNEATLKLLGYSQEELLGQELHFLMSGNAPEAAGTDCAHLFDKIHNGGCINIETHYVTHEMQKIPVLFSGSLLLDKGKNVIGAVCVATNISALRQAQAELATSYDMLQQTQEQLIQSSKLASIGELAAGVAHELNQPLMIIRSGTQLLDRKRKKGTLDERAFDKHLNSILDNSKRMMKIINHLRTFSRQSSSEFVPVDIHEAIKNCYYLIGEQLRHRNIVIEEDFSKDLPKVLGDINQIEQVILNLLGNARDSIEDKRGTSTSPDLLKGLIRIKTRVAHDNPLVIELLVQDSGAGIPPEMKAKIFDPFFSTKEIGKGTGLGLSISYGIIRDHQGEISVAETGQEGTTFLIRLPVRNE